MDKLVASLVFLFFTALLLVSFIDSAHKRTVTHACQMAAIEARYPSADAVVICNLK